MVRQEERRASTRAAFVQAAADSLLANGVSGFTIADVVSRSGMSNGALFRYFPTRTDLLASTVEFVFAHARDQYAERYAALTISGPDAMTPQVLLTLLWSVMDDPSVAMVYEVYAVARTDSALQMAIAPMIRDHVELLTQLGRDVVVEITDSDPAVVDEMISLAILAMQGLVLSRPVVPEPDDGERLIATLANAAEHRLDFRVESTGR
jgi:AcrR family transcriptional regulator